MYRKYSNSNIPFQDLLFNIALLFVALFAIAYFLMAEMTKAKDIDLMAEFVITVTWDKDSKDDVDIWVSDPMENEIWYHNKESGSTTLDRDDRGWLTDTITLPDGTIQVININQEIVTIRKAMAGEWRVSLCMYLKRDIKDTKVHVLIQKLNPKNTIIYSKEVIMTHTKQEIGIIRMEMTESGEILDFNKTPTCIVCNRFYSYPSGGQVRNPR